MSYPQAVAYLNSFVNHEKKNVYPYQSFKLARMRGFLRLLGNPQDDLKCLHIAGTKGKGSTCVFLAYILKEAGLKAGLYTSPHLVDVRERIRVLNPKSEIRNKSQISNLKSQIPYPGFEGMISRKEMTRLAERFKPVIEQYRRRSEYGDLTFFEVWTALAFMYFKEQKVDYALLETGLGGRLDATNTVKPLVCGITPISYDHTQYLGKTLRRITREKAGIIKNRKSQIANRKLSVVSACQEKEAREVIRKRCAEKGAELYEAGKDISWQAKGFPSGGQLFDVKGLKRMYNNLKIRLLGEHQLENAALAVGMVEALGDKRIRPEHIRRGLEKAVWPGRLEIISRNPYIVLDGAQNAASALALREAIRKYFKYRKLILVLGVSADKDIKGICDNLRSLADVVILTRAANPRAADPRELAGYFPEKGTVTADRVRKALMKAKAMAEKEDLILVTGSLFVVGETLDSKPALELSSNAGLE